METRPPNESDATSEGAAHSPPTAPDLRVRWARIEDAEAVATILAEAFPALYRAMFGTRGNEDAAWLLAEFFRAELLPLQTTRVCERGRWVVGVAMLHLDGSPHHGSARTCWRLLRRQLGLWRGLRAFLGWVLLHFFMDRRIPRDPDLVYIKALAVAETERGRGVGTRLIEDTAQWAREQQRPWLALHVLDSNVRARRLYERLGFRPWHADRARSLWSRFLSRTRPDWSGTLMRRPAQDNT